MEIMPCTKRKSSRPQFLFLLFFRDNIVQVRIFLQDLNYHVIEDVAKYQLANLCGKHI